MDERVLPPATTSQLLQAACTPVQHIQCSHSCLHEQSQRSTASSLPIFDSHLSPDRVRAALLSNIEGRKEKGDGTRLRVLSRFSSPKDVKADNASLLFLLLRPLPLRSSPASFLYSARIHSRISLRQLQQPLAPSPSRSSLIMPSESSRLPVPEHFNEELLDKHLYYTYSNGSVSASPHLQKRC
jgi:hypothetical protein